jgi:hypothetical protein
MADLLLYAAIDGQKKLLFPDTAAGGFAQYSFEANTSEDNAATVVIPYPSLSSAAGNAWRTSLVNQWSTVFDEYTSPKTNSLCCGDFYSGYYRCGATGNWVVPAGVSRATFQLWGAGSGSSQNCCCGGSPAGINGAYALAVVDVCPGEVFCWCAGCSFCCCGEQDSVPGGYNGTCGTVISYCGNPNTGVYAGGYSGAWCMCAPGAPNMHMCAWNCQVCKTFSGYGTSCNLSLPSIATQCQANNTMTQQVNVFTKCNQCSVQTCSSCWSFCWDGTADDMYIPPIYACRVPFTTCAAAVTAKNVIFRGIPTMYPEVLIGCDMNASGFTQPAPVYGFTTPLLVQPGVPLANSYICYSGNTCAGHCSNPDAGGLCIPGMGATGSGAYGGINAGSYTGGRGRTGMICISWEVD